MCEYTCENTGFMSLVTHDMYMRSVPTQQTVKRRHKFTGFQSRQARTRRSNTNVDHITPEGDCYKCNGWGSYVAALGGMEGRVECEVCDGTGEQPDYTDELTGEEQ